MKRIKKLIDKKILNLVVAAAHEECDVERYRLLTQIDKILKMKGIAMEIDE